MSKLYSSKQIQAVLERLGFVLVSQKGSHGKFKSGKGNIAITYREKRNS